MRMTRFELDEYLRRRNAKVLVQDGGFKDGVEREADLHSQIFAEIRRRGWIGLHGAMSERTHRTAGEVDFCCLAEGGKVLFVECKTKTGKLSPAQSAMKFHMEKLGHAYHVVRSLGEFIQMCADITKEKQ